MNIEIDGCKYDVEIIKKNNRNTYIRVKDGKIIVTTNYLSSKSSIIKLINDNKDSLIKMITTDNKKKEKNTNFYYFGKKYDVIYGFSSIEFDSDRIYANNEKSLIKYIDNEIKRIYKERLDYLYGLFEKDIPYPKLVIRKMTSRWGVCNVTLKKVTLNYELYKYDLKCLDYVIIHELSHFIYQNHSKDFWLLVSKYCSNYKECRKMLKE